MSRRSRARRHARRPGRLLAVRVVALTATVIAASLVVTTVRSGRADRAYAASVSRLTGAVTQMIATTLGEAMIDPQVIQWRGLRIYDPALDDWTPLDASPPQAPGPDVVLLVHGLDEPGGIWDQLAPALAEAGHTVVRFDYANDQPISDSADELEIALATLRDRAVRDLDLVCHSMGGLVSYDAISRDEFDTLGLRVGHLITLGTPFAGSPWARLRALAEVREQVQRWAESDDMDPRRLLGFVHDGVGQAGADLLPHSPYLSTLQGRTLPDSIAVTCVVGRTTADPSRETLGRVIADKTLGDLLGENDARVIRDELVRLSDELGDGVVPVSSAALDGVEDVVIVQANHRSMIRNIELGEAIREMNNLPAGTPPPGIEIVLDRLNRD